LPADKPRSGTSERRRAFVQAYLANGHNATRAAIAAGYSAKTAASQGQRLLKNVETKKLLTEAARQVAQRVELDTESTLRSCAAVAYNDPRRFYNPDGSYKPISEWTEDMAACVASIETKELFDDDGKLVGYVRKLKFWSRNEATNMAMRHAGLFETDNRQRAPNLALQINLIQAPVKPNDTNGPGSGHVNLDRKTPR
jgi:phage terminase small subunit